MKFIAVIPARYASVRFPGKPLAILNNKPIIQHVYERVSNSNLFSDVIVATDEESIANTVKNFKGKVCMTSASHPSGSDRIAEVIKDMDCDVVFNVQGDEPMIDGETLAKLKEVFNNEQVMVASLMTPIMDEADIQNTNVVKVVTDNNMNSLYFSRSPIPHNRDKQQDIIYYRHIGVYAYKKQALLDFVKLTPGKLEQIEKLEQLRFLENGISVKMVQTTYQGIGIDTYDDFIKVANLLSKTQ